MTNRDNMRLNSAVEEALGGHGHQGTPGADAGASAQNDLNDGGGSGGQRLDGDDTVIMGCRGITTFGAMRQLMRQASSPCHGSNRLNRLEEDEIGRSDPFAS